MKTIPFLLLAFVAFSCGKKEKDDTSPPIVGTVTLNGSHQLLEHHAGDTLNAYIKIADNELLKSAKVEIHGGGGHTHRVTSEFDYLNIIPLSLQVEEINIKIPVPADTEAGEYHFTVQAIDAAGNESEMKVLELDIH